MVTYEKTIGWLRNQGLLNKFFKYHRMYPLGFNAANSVKDIFQGCLSKQKYSFVVTDFTILCFTYEDTPEGLSYWCNIERLFRNWCYEEGY